jgi:hypothetical protein
MLTVADRLAENAEAREDAAREGVTTRCDCQCGGAQLSTDRQQQPIGE